MLGHSISILTWSLVEFILYLVVVDFFFFHFQNDRSILRDDQPSCIPNAMFMFSVKCFCHLFEG